MHEHRLAAQLLAGPRARGPVEVTQRLLAVQAQDQRGARLAIRARSDLVTVNGIFKAFALVGGRAAGTWSLRDGRVTLEPFAPLDHADAAALAADAADVERFLNPARGAAARAPA